MRSPPETVPSPAQSPSPIDRSRARARDQCGAQSRERRLQGRSQSPERACPSSTAERQRSRAVVLTGPLPCTSSEGYSSKGRSLDDPGIRSSMARTVSGLTSASKAACYDMRRAALHQMAVANVSRRHHLAPLARPTDVVALARGDMRQDLPPKARERLQPQPIEPVRRSGLTSLMGRYGETHTAGACRERSGP
jgi:hypothetical protein